MNYRGRKHHHAWNEGKIFHIHRNLRNNRFMSVHDHWHFPLWIPDWKFNGRVILFNANQRDFYLGLSDKPQKTDVGFNIILGGWDNRRSVVRHGNLDKHHMRDIHSVDKGVENKEQTYWMRIIEEERFQLGKGTKPGIDFKHKDVKK